MNYTKLLVLARMAGTAYCTGPHKLKSYLMKYGQNIGNNFNVDNYNIGVF